MNDTNTSGNAFDVFHRLALACERMIDFRRQVDREERFRNVAASTNLREYSQGWTFHEYVEALIDRRNGWAPSWSFELSEEGGQWRIYTYVAIAYDDYFEEIDIRLVPLDGDFGQELDQCVSRLLASYEVGTPLRQRIDELLAQSTREGETQTE